MRAFKHIGLYAYRRDTVLRLAALPPTALEETEMLEQLRALEHGIRIKVVQTELDVDWRRHRRRRSARARAARGVTVRSPMPDPFTIMPSPSAPPSKPVKYIFVTGGVVSSLGKGLAAASIGCLLEGHGYKVTLQKFDPYINVDPGTMSPYQHGEVYVTDDGARDRPRPRATTSASPTR